MGGSLRNPASYCNVVGFRPSIGRMPMSRGMGVVRADSEHHRSHGENRSGNLLCCSRCRRGPTHTDPLTLARTRPNTFLTRWWRRIRLDGYKHRLQPQPAWSAHRCFGRGGGWSDGCGGRDSPIWVQQVVETAPDLSRAMEVFQVQRAAVSLANLGKASLDLKPFKDWKCTCQGHRHLEHRKRAWR